MASSLVNICLCLSFHMKKKKSQGQVNVPECFKKKTTKSIYMLYRLIL